MEALFAKGCKVYVPRIVGKESKDMKVVSIYLKLKYWCPLIGLCGGSDHFCVIHPYEVVWVLGEPLPYLSFVAEMKAKGGWDNAGLKPFHCRIFTSQVQILSQEEMETFPVSSWNIPEPPVDSLNEREGHQAPLM